MEEAKTREPFKKVLSENVEVLYGYKDAHAVVRVRLPIPLRPWYSVDIPADAILKFKQNFEDAHAFGVKGEADRKGQEPVQFYARDDCRGRWGYLDSHVELDVKRIVWITVTFPFDEFKLAKAAMDEAYVWAGLPEHVRDLQGA